MQVDDNACWIERQFGPCQLGNALRTTRLQRVAANMLERPEQSLPAQNPEWADLKAAYRLFQHPRVTFEAVSAEHWRQTRQTPPGRYLLISDATEINHDSHEATVGLGSLGKGTTRGLVLHSCLAYDSDRGQVTGVAGAAVHYRPLVKRQETLMQRLRRDRESQLWGQTVAAIGAPPAGSQWIHVFDRGGDSFEAMCHIKLTGCDWIIRAAKLHRKVRLPTGETVPLDEALAGAQALGSYELSLRSRPGVKARTATLDVSATQVALPRPKHSSPWTRQCGIQELGLQVVLVRERHAPRGSTPIQWTLLTSLPIQSFDDARQVIEDYERRWLIEEYHKALKTGCGAERHALRSADRLEPLLGLIAVVATRLLQLKLIGRHQPDAQAATHVPASWRTCLTLARPKLDSNKLTVYEFFRELANMGGFLGRKHDGEPGWQTIWRGYQKLQLLLEGMRLAQSLKPTKLG